MNTLQFLRGRARLRQIDLADSLAVTQPQISLYESGRPIPTDHAAHLLAIFRERLGDSLDMGPILRKLQPLDLTADWEDLLTELSNRP